MSEHRCGFDFVDRNQPWAECACGKVQTNPSFMAVFFGAGIHMHLGNVKLSYDDDEVEDLDDE